MDLVEGAAHPTQVAVHQAGLGEVLLDGRADLLKLAGAAFAGPGQQRECGDGDGEDSDRRALFHETCSLLGAGSCSTRWTVVREMR